MATPPPSTLHPCHQTVLLTHLTRQDLADLIQTQYVLITRLGIQPGSFCEGAFVLTLSQAATSSKPLLAAWIVQRAGAIQHINYVVNSRIIQCGMLRVVIPQLTYVCTKNNTGLDRVVLDGGFCLPLDSVYPVDGSQIQDWTDVEGGLACRFAEGQLGAQLQFDKVCQLREEKETSSLCLLPQRIITSQYNSLIYLVS